MAFKPVAFDPYGRRKRSAWRFVRHLDIGWWGRSYITVAGGALDDDI